MPFEAAPPQRAQSQNRRLSRTKIYARIHKTPRRSLGRPSRSVGFLPGLPPRGSTRGPSVLGGLSPHGESLTHGPFWMDAVKRGNFRAEKAQDGVRRYRHPCPGESGQRPFPGRGTSASRRPRRPSLGSPQGVYGHLVSPVAGGLWQGGPSPAQTQIGAPWRTLACSASAPDLPAVLLGRDGEMLGGILGGQGAELDGELDDLLRLQLLQRIGKPPLRPVPLP